MISQDDESCPVYGAVPCVTRAMTRTFRVVGVMVVGSTECPSGDSG